MSETFEVDAEHSEATTDHEAIREWVEERGGEPATVSEAADGEAGVLRLEFPDTRTGHEGIEPVEWEAWFATFEAEELAFVYQELTEDDNTSRFYKLVDRATVRER